MAKDIDKRSLAEQIKDTLVSQVTSGQLAPGERLIELKIAQEMGTSQAPVREAMRALEALGLIEMRRNRGAVVREVGAAEIRDIYAVRAELEGLATETVAATQRQLAGPLMSLCRDMSAALARKETNQFIALNDRFHRMLVEASGNAVLIDLWSKLDVRARTAMNVARAARPLDLAVEEHFAIARAIEDGDAKLARARMVDHILSVVGPDT